MALATRPRLLLLDEPVAGMGTDESQRMIELLATLKGDKTIVLVEHDMDAVFSLADRISVLVYGRIIATGTPAEIRANAEVRARLPRERTSDARGRRDWRPPTAAPGPVRRFLRIEAGQVATLLGRNGMGKTTTVRSIMGMIPLQGGQHRLRRRSHRGPALLPHRAGRHRPGARGPADLPQPHGAREPGRHRRQPARREGSLDAGEGLRLVPQPEAADRAITATSSPAASSRCSRSAAR